MSGVDSLAVFLVPGFSSEDPRTDDESFLALEVVGFMKLNELLAVLRLLLLSFLSADKLLDRRIEAVLVLAVDMPTLEMSLLDMLK